jgi:hypothetical protein
VLNQMKAKDPEAHRKYRHIDKSRKDIRARLLRFHGRAAARALPWACRCGFVDGEIVAFNAGVPAFMVKGQLEDDIGPRLVTMVRHRGLAGAERSARPDRVLPRARRRVVLALRAFGASPSSCSSPGCRGRSPGVIRAFHLRAAHLGTGSCAASAR